MDVDAYRIAERFIGIRELPGDQHEPFVMSMLRLDADWPQADEVPWCSAFVNFVAWILGLPRTRSLRARSWLKCEGTTLVNLPAAKVGFDIVILKRGSGAQPGADVIDAPGHVGFYAGARDGRILILGGNQGNSVNVSPYAISRVLGIRRLWG